MSVEVSARGPEARPVGAMRVEVQPYVHPLFQSGPIVVAYSDGVLAATTCTSPMWEDVHAMEMRYGLAITAALQGAARSPFVVVDVMANDMPRFKVMAACHGLVATGHPFLRSLALRYVALHRNHQVVHVSGSPWFAMFADGAADAATLACCMGHGYIFTKYGHVLARRLAAPSRVAVADADRDLFAAYCAANSLDIGAAQ